MPQPARPTTVDPLTTSRHDPEPWSRNYGEISDKNGVLILLAEEGGPRKGPRATYKNAIRAVQCVNACANLPDPAASLSDAQRRLHDVLLLLPYATAVVEGCNKPNTVNALREITGQIQAALSSLGGPDIPQTTPLPLGAPGTDLPTSTDPTISVPTDAPTQEARAKATEEYIKALQDVASMAETASVAHIYSKAGNSGVYNRDINALARARREARRYNIPGVR